MFATYMFLSGKIGLFYVWYPDPNHQDHNDGEAVYDMAGLGDCKAKLKWLSKWLLGPHRKSGQGGAWKQQQLAAWNAVRPRVLVEGTIENDEFQSYADDICNDSGNAYNLHFAYQQTDKFSRLRGNPAKDSRWHVLDQA